MTDSRHFLMDSLERLYKAARLANLPAETHEVLSRDAQAIGDQLYRIANPVSDIERHDTEDSHDAE